MLKKQEKKYIRHRRVRAKVFGTASRPRLCVFKSLNHIYVQAIDDQKQKTLMVAADYEIKKSESSPRDKNLTAKVLKAYEVGKLIAQKALEKEIKEVVFDRGGYQYHGRVKALAEGAREGGLKF